MEVAVGLEPTKTGFAGQHLGHFGIATKLVLNLVQTCTQLYTQSCTQIALTTPIYPPFRLCKLLKPYAARFTAGFADLALPLGDRRSYPN